MKKLFTLIAAALSSMSMMATDFTCPLSVAVDGVENPSGEVTVSVVENNGKYTFELKDFYLVMGEDQMAVGTIKVENITGEKCGIVESLSTQQTIRIQNGTSDDEIWVGPMLEDVPINMKAEIKNGKELNAVLCIDMGNIGIINVNLGKNANEIGQIPNSNFDLYHNFKKHNEPNAWHSFKSGTGLAALAADAVTITEDRLNPTDNTKHSVKLTSAKTAGVSANGTITNGRLTAGSYDPNSPKNYSFSDFSITEKDKNGDPFYTVLTSKPDELHVWVKYHVGTRDGSNKGNVFASVNAVLTDGTPYHDPEDKTYDNVIAKATNKEIAATDDWKEVVAYFDYNKTNVNPKAILVTLSTCAVPGGGSLDTKDNDMLWIDDFSLVYKAGLKSLSCKGTDIKVVDGQTDYTVTANGEINLNDINVVSDGQGASITKSIDESNDHVVNITIMSNDLKIANKYKLTVEGGNVVTGIKAPQSVTLPNGVQAIYNLAGQQVGSMTPGQVYIVKTTDGQTKKVIKK